MMMMMMMMMISDNHNIIKFKIILIFINNIPNRILIDLAILILKIFKDLIISRMIFKIIIIFIKEIRTTIIWEEEDTEDNLKEEMMI